MLCVAAISLPWACAVAIDSAANQAPRPGPRSDSDADPEGACLNKCSLNFFVFLSKFLEKIAMSNVECRMSNVECRMSNLF